MSNHIHTIEQTMARVAEINAVERAVWTGGVSNEAIYNMVGRTLDKYGIGGNTIVDVGCGVGNLKQFVEHKFASYIGADIARYEMFPEDAEFFTVNLDTGRVPLPDGCADAVVAVETIEHLENPRSFMRELTRLAKPGGWVIVTTPNQLSLLSILTLLRRQQYAAFQDCEYPAHLTALLEIDLRRIASECNLTKASIEYSLSGRIPLTPWNYSGPVARMFPRLLSGNLLLCARKK
jgi:2-polyprenyl-3-methyl-5-hydroxy-6-metoxy-1,4-benzoquinol methylase